MRTSILPFIVILGGCAGADRIDDAGIDGGPRDLEDAIRADAPGEDARVPDASFPDVPRTDVGRADASCASPECTAGTTETRTVQGACQSYEERRTCDAECTFGPWTGEDPSVQCGDVCAGEEVALPCDAAGNVTTQVCDAATGTMVDASTLYGCTVTSEPGAGGRICPGALFTRSCWPIPGGQARVSWRCDGTAAPPGGTFTQVDADYCTASSGPEAGTHFCPGEVILRDSCGAGGARNYFMCPESADTGTNFAGAATLGCNIEAQEWEPLHRGVDLQRWTAGGRRYRALRIDLCDASIRIAATEEANRGARTSSWGAGQNMLAAINGGFFVGGFAPDACVAFGGGREWSRSADSAVRSFIAFGPDNTYISETAAIERPPYASFPWMEEAVCGDAIIVRGSVAQPTGGTARRARTAVGFSGDRRTLYFLTVDSPGLTVTEMGPPLAALGVDYGLNLDGGGSTTMWTRSLGLINRPSDGSERVVANHLGVWIEGGARGYNCPR